MSAMDRGRAGRYPSQHNPTAQVVSGPGLAASALADYTRVRCTAAPAGDDVETAKSGLG